MLFETVLKKQNLFFENSSLKAQREFTIPGNSANAATIVRQGSYLNPDPRTNKQIFVTVSESLKIHFVLGDHVYYIV